MKNIHPIYNIKVSCKYVRLNISLLHKKTKLILIGPAFRVLMIALYILFINSRGGTCFRRILLSFVSDFNDQARAGKGS